MRKPGVLIFDFDGTLADTFGLATREFRKFFKNSERATDDAAVEQLRGMTAREAFKSIGIKWWQLPRLVYMAREAVRREIDTIQSYDGMGAVLEQLHHDGVRMIIVSSNSTKNINTFLRNNHMQTYFERAYGGTGIFDKARALKKIMRDKHLAVDECAYIGDEARDMEAARRAGVRSVGVTWGFNNRHALQAAHPEALVDHPKDLLSLFSAKQ